MLAQPSTARNTLLDPEWISAIGEQLLLNPAGVQFAVEPPLMGMYDRQMGQPCQPARWYCTDTEIAAYVTGWQSVTVTLACTGVDYITGQEDAQRERYEPPHPALAANFDAYVRGFNDTWAAANGHTLTR